MQNKLSDIARWFAISALWLSVALLILPSWMFNVLGGLGLSLCEALIVRAKQLGGLTTN